jgi:hypothetical protein
MIDAAAWRWEADPVALKQLLKVIFVSRFGRFVLEEHRHPPIPPTNGVMSVGKSIFGGTYLSACSLCCFISLKHA